MYVCVLSYDFGSITLAKGIIFHSNPSTNCTQGSVWWPWYQLYPGIVLTHPGTNCTQGCNIKSEQCQLHIFSFERFDFSFLFKFFHISTVTVPKNEWDSTSRTHHLFILLIWSKWMKMNSICMHKKNSFYQNMSLNAFFFFVKARILLCWS
jgi:hypothetical protein